MKATGIVRRIDELGRVVIPKEIRRTLRIKEGYPLEIYVGKDGEIVLKKYSPMGEMGDSAGDFADALQRVSGHTAIITDREVVVSVGGTAMRRQMLDKPLSHALEELMQERTAGTLMGADALLPQICEGIAQDAFSAITFAPILSEGELSGMVLLAAQEKPITQVDEKLVQYAAMFFGNQMEN